MYTATGTPRAVISWLRNNNVLISSNSLSDGGVPVIITNSTIGNCSITDPPSQCVSSSTLQILNTRAVDSGEYTCVATNEAGRDTEAANLIVNGIIRSVNDMLPEILAYMWCIYYYNEY